MAGGVERPVFVLFGSSIVQHSYSNGGWGAHLSDIYSRKADVLLRGYGAWNSRRALHVVNQVFPKNATVQPDLVIVYFGGNDSMDSHPTGLGPHVPLEEYTENMRQVLLHLKSLSDKTRIVFLTCPPINEEQLRTASTMFSDLKRTNEALGRYAEATVELCREAGVKYADLFTAFQKKDNWEKSCFTDGIHLSAEGSLIVVDEILKVLQEAEWEPSLYWKDLPTEFAEDSPYDLVASNGKETINTADWTYHRDHWQ